MLFLRIRTDAEDLRVFRIVDPEREIVAGKEVVEFRTGKGGEGNAGAIDLSLQLFHGIVFIGFDEAVDEGRDRGVGPEDGEEGVIGRLDQLDQMWQGAIPALLKFAEEPDVGGEEAGGGFAEEVALHVDPFPVQGEQHGPGCFYGVGDVGECGGMYGIAAVTAREVVEVQRVKSPGTERVCICVSKGVIGEPGERGVFEIVDEQCHLIGKALGNQLTEKVAGLARSRFAHDEGARVRVQIQDAFAGLFF